MVPGSRIYYHGSLSELLKKNFPVQEIVIITEKKTERSHFQLFQISQAFLETLLQSDPVLIIEASPVLGQFILPPNKGRVIVLGTDYISLYALTQTVGFLSGRQLNLWETALYLKGISQFEDSKPVSFFYSGYPIQIPMNSMQYQEYLSRLSQDHNPEKYSALQITNFLYPPALQQQHNIPRNLRPQLPRDRLVSEGGWIEPGILNEYASRSPKLAWLEKYLRQNPGKHVIYTSFNEYYGVQVLATLLKILGHHVVTITGSDSQKDRLLKMKDFQEICITNLYPFTEFPDVKSFIIFEQTGSDSLLNVYLKQLPDQITVLFLISAGPNGEPTLETSNYLQLVSRLEIRNILIELLQGSGVSLEKVRKNLGVPQLTEFELEKHFKLRR